MKVFLILISLMINVNGQENFGIREKVNSYAEKQVKKVLAQEFFKRLDKFKNLKKDPKKYYESIGMTDKEMKQFYKSFPGILKEGLPKVTITKTGIITLRAGNETAHFSFKDLIKKQIYIKGKLVKLPPRGAKNFAQYFNKFNENVYEAFSKKTTFLDYLNRFHIISSVHAESEYLNLPDDEDVPHYNFEGYEGKQDKFPNLYEDEEVADKKMYGKFVQHNVSQTKQILLAAVVALNVDLNLFEWANFEDKKINIPKNLKKLYDRIGKLATSCDQERIETGGKFKEGSEATKMLTALESVNENLNRVDSLMTEWWWEVDNVVWDATSFHVDPSNESYNICKAKRITEMYEDKNLCANMDKLTQCLIDFRTSGKVSNTRLNDEQMELLLGTHTNKDYGQEDVLKWVQEK